MHVGPNPFLARWEVSQGWKPPSRSSRGPKDHVNMRILQSGSKQEDKGDYRNLGLQDPSVYVVSWALSEGNPIGITRVSKACLSGWKRSNHFGNPLHAAGASLVANFMVSQSDCRCSTI